MTKFFAVLAVLVVALSPVLVFASDTCNGANCPPPGGGNGGNGGNGGSAVLELPNPLSCEGAQCVLTTIIKAFMALAAPVVVLMILIGAFQILTAGGNPEKITSGKRTITYALIGFVVILLASSFIYIIQDLFGVSSQ